LIIKNIQTYVPMLGDIWVVNLGDKSDLRGVVGILLGDFYLQLKFSVLVGAVFWANQGGLPVEQVQLVVVGVGLVPFWRWFLGRVGTEGGGRVSLYVFQVFQDPFQRHSLSQDH